MIRVAGHWRGPCVALLVFVLCACQGDPKEAPQDIHQAARDGNAAAVRRALAADDALVHSVDEEQRTPLHLAADTDSVEVVEVLLESGADVDAKARGGDTPLHRAVLRGSPQIVEVILRQNPDPNVQNSYGRTPLLYVARETGSTEMARRLLDAGAEINVLDRYGASSLELAAWRGFRPLVNLLLDRGAELPAAEEGLTEVTIFSAQHGLSRLFELAVEQGADLSMENDGGGTLLHSAAAGGSVDIVEILLEQGMEIAAPDRYGWTPLHYAAQEGHGDIVSSLISGGAPSGVRSLAGDSPYNVAVASRQQTVLQIMEDEGVNTDPSELPRLVGPYFAQSPPGLHATIFAPDLVSSNRFEHGSVTFAPHGMEAFWSSSFIVDDSGYTRGRIMTSRQSEEGWAAPDFAPFSTDYVGDDVPHFLPDGSRLFFLSGRPETLGEESPGEQIWYVDRTELGWSRPFLIEGGPNELSKHWQFSVAANGNIYFNSGDPGGMGSGDIYISRYRDGQWGPAENLGSSINTEHDEFSPFVAPDESYLIVSVGGRPENVGTIDLYISFRNGASEWTPLVNMGEAVNSASHELCPFVTTDGKYLFFNSHRGGQADVFWIDAEIIDQFRPSGR